MQKEIEQTKALPQKPTLLLHACCAPCSTYVLEYLCPYFDISLLYYNPNIFPEDEYNKRDKELVRLADAMKEERIEGAENIKVVVLPYTPSDFYEIAKGKEDIPEGGARCFEC